MVNFQFDPNPSDAQRIVDTTNKIKKQKMEEQTAEMKMQEAQMQMQESSMRLRAGEIKMQEAVKAQEIDTLSEQTYNGVLAATGNTEEALRATGALRSKLGGYNLRMADEKDRMARTKEAMEGETMTPQLAQHIADINNAAAPVGAPKATAQSIQQKFYQAKAKVTADGELQMFDPTKGEYVATSVVSKAKKDVQDKEASRKDAELASDVAYKSAKLKLEAQGLGLEQQRITQSAAQHADTQARLRTAAEDKKIAVTQKLQDAKASPKLTETDKILVKQIEKTTALGNSFARSLAMGKPEPMIETLMRSQGITVGKDEDWKEKVQGLIDAVGNTRNLALTELAKSETGRKTAESLNTVLETDLDLTPAATVQVQPQANPMLPPPLPSVLPSKLAQTSGSDLPPQQPMWAVPGQSAAETVVKSGAVNKFRKGK